MQVTAAVVEQLWCGIRGRPSLDLVGHDDRGDAEFFPLDRIEDAVTASYEGAVIKPILTMPH